MPSLTESSEVRQGLSGTLPLKQGQKIDLSKLSEGQRRALHKTGIDPNDLAQSQAPATPQATQQMKAFDAVDPHAAQSYLEEAINKNPPKDGEEKQWNELSPEKQDEILTAIEAGRRDHPENASPIQEFAAAVVPNTTAPVDIPITTVATEHEPCPHCGFHPDEPKGAPTDADKIVFLQAIQGGQRFSKTYALFSGHLRLSFRSLSTAERTACRQFAGSSRDSDGSARLLKESRMVCALATVARKDGDMQQLPVLEDWIRQAQSGKPENVSATLARVISYIQMNILKEETSWRSAVQCFDRFQETVHHLETGAANDPFWQTTASPP